MESKAKIMGHPIHPILIPFPLGLLSTSAVFDVVHLLTGNGKWSQISFWMIAAGIIGGLAATVFGLIDWLAIPSGTRAKAVGMWHGATNVVMVTLFTVSWLLRADGAHWRRGLAEESSRADTPLRGAHPARRRRVRRFRLRAHGHRRSRFARPDLAALAHASAGGRGRCPGRLAAGRGFLYRGLRPVRLGGFRPRHDDGAGRGRGRVVGARIAHEAPAAIIQNEISDHFPFPVSR